MNCEQAKRLLEAYADGELDVSVIPELERHLHECPACAASLSNLQNLKKALRHDAPPTDSVRH